MTLVEQTHYHQEVHAALDQLDRKEEPGDKKQETYQEACPCPHGINIITEEVHPDHSYSFQQKTRIQI